MSVVDVDALGGHEAAATAALIGLGVKPVTADVIMRSHVAPLLDRASKAVSSGDIWGENAIEAAVGATKEALLRAIHFGLRHSSSVESTPLLVSRPDGTPGLTLGSRGAHPRGLPKALESDMEARGMLCFVDAALSDAFETAFGTPLPLRAMQSSSGSPDLDALLEGLPVRQDGARGLLLHAVPAERADTLSALACSLQQRWDDVIRTCGADSIVMRALAHTAWVPVGPFDVVRRGTAHHNATDTDGAANSEGLVLVATPDGASCVGMATAAAFGPLGLYAKVDTSREMEGVGLSSSANAATFLAQLRALKSLREASVAVGPLGALCKDRVRVAMASAWDSASRVPLGEWKAFLTRAYGSIAEEMRREHPCRGVREALEQDAVVAVISDPRRSCARHGRVGARNADRTFEVSDQSLIRACRKRVTGGQEATSRQVPRAAFHAK